MVLFILQHLPNLFLTTYSLNCPFRPISLDFIDRDGCLSPYVNILVDLGCYVTLTFESSDEKRSNVKHGGVL